MNNQESQLSEQAMAVIVENHIKKLDSLYNRPILKIEVRNEENLKKIIGSHQIWLQSLSGSSSSVNGQRANFSGKDLRGFSFSEQDLRGANFEGANIEGVDFKNANLAYANFNRAMTSDADFTDADLDGTILTK